ncbi:hypothetical protein RHGRI_011123 [Rhododendron griersonianum]|uniref:Transposase-associated domain-containing protein n=1 Tax=Rhododendron griersonianum TaxID=479676 RepID=A0AAV6KLQ8_9ERIC|nr:hypothetical protein RHGRI_011123 [Rhododendron griersonianum]
MDRNGSLCWLESLPGFFKLTPMDKSWIDIRKRLDPTYIEGVEKFLDFAYDKKHPDSKIYCPCKKCVNLIFGTRSGVKEHLIINGFNTNYTRWTIHGESLASSSRNESDANQSSSFQDDMIGMVHDAFGVPRQDGEIRDNAGLGSMGLGPDKETKKFFKLLEDAQRELYPNCKTFTALSFTTHLLHIKVLGGWTDSSYDMLVELLRKAFPVRETLPKSKHIQVLRNDSRRLSERDLMRKHNEQFPNWFKDHVSLVNICRTIPNISNHHIKDEITCPQAEPYSGQQLDDGTYTLDNGVNWVRTDVDGVIVDDDIDGDDHDNVGAEDSDEEEVDYSDEEEVDYSDEEEDCTDDDDDDFEENDEDGDHNKDD